ncbi:MAG TPA: hypothetical protein VHV30_00900 [Polyangiaceae bacterium]|nr:hypothetical protein [Polyangiaceae bacterium]
MTGEGRGARALPSAFITDLLLAGVAVGLKLAIDAWVLRLGFSHVSDDDYARTVIAERFALAPHLDPSGTSWLPLPFWVTGGAMAIVGRSLESARAIAVVLGALGVIAPFAAMRGAGVSRPAAMGATLAAMALPWSAWLDVATVPDGWTAALIAAGAIAMRVERARAWAAAALLAASLARYEAWPACAVFAVFAGVTARRLEGAARRRAIVCAIIAMAGPVLWMAWNAHAHGSPFHFVARVTAFRRAIGAADLPLRDKLLGYPRALVGEVPEAAVLGALGIAGAARSRPLRDRWLAALGVALAVLVFLVIGDLGDGAPTHHPARALGAVGWILVGAGVDTAVTAAAGASARAARVAVAVAGGAVALAWTIGLPGRWAEAPGNSDYERRDAQIARGRALRDEDVAAAQITPCQFEHFALIAAWGRPDRAQVRPRTGAPLTSACPAVAAGDPDDAAHGAVAR